MGICGRHANEERREPAIELVQERLCNDYCIEEKSELKIGHEYVFDLFASCSLS